MYRDNAVIFHYPAIHPVVVGGGDGSSGQTAFNESGAVAAAAAKHVCALDFSPTYSVISSLISFFIPCVIMVGIYFHVYSFARYHRYRIKEHNKPLLREAIQ